jgi:hypothetical protein
MDFLTFSRQLEKSGIPRSLYKGKIEENIDLSLNLVAEVCQSYPSHEKNPPSFAQHIITQVVTCTQCQKYSSLEDVALRCWTLQITIEKHKTDHAELSLIWRYSNDFESQDEFAFYLKVIYIQARKLVTQLKVGDNPKASVLMKNLSLKTDEWVNIVSLIFNSEYKPTACVERISHRLLESEYTTEIPAIVLLKTCMSEYEDIKSKSKAASSHRRNSSTSTVYKRIEDLLDKKNQQRPLPIPNQKNKYKLPQDWDIMSYAKRKRPMFHSNRKMRLLDDEELANATVDKSPHRRPQTVHYYQVNTQEDSADEDPWHSGVTDDLTPSRKEIEQLTSERDRLREALEETIEFCDAVSYEHDLLLTQNVKIKRVLSLVTDKLIRMNPKLLYDIDFGDVINDPCSEFQPTGILKETLGYDTPKEVELENRPRQIDDHAYFSLSGKEENLLSDSFSQYQTPKQEKTRVAVSQDSVQNLIPLSEQLYGTEVDRGNKMASLGVRNKEIKGTKTFY